MKKFSFAAFAASCEAHGLSVLDYEHLCAVNLGPQIYTPGSPGDLPDIAYEGELWRDFFLPWRKKRSPPLSEASLQSLVSRGIIRRQLRSTFIHSAPGCPPHERSAGVWYLTRRGASLYTKLRYRSGLWSQPYWVWMHHIHWRRGERSGLLTARNPEELHNFCLAYGVADPLTWGKPRPIGAWSPDGILRFRSGWQVELRKRKE